MATLPLQRLDQTWIARRRKQGENVPEITSDTFNNVDHPQVGPKWYPGFAWKMSVTPGQVHWPAPTLGQHNHTVYSEFLGLTDAAITNLEETGVIGTKPTGSRII